MMHGRHALLAMCATVGTAAGAQTAGVQLFAAGSLREALTEVARNFETERGHKVALTFGASGLLRERIENGEAAQVFASADMDHPQRLAQAGSWSVPKVFAHNLMCALVAPSVNATPETLLKTLLEPAIRVGTSTPKADPSGDYAWEIFRRADIVQPGAFAAPEGKALKLTDAAGLAQPPAGRNTYAWLMDEGKADVFLTHCTNAATALHDVPRLKVIQVPAALQVAASYGVTVRRDADPGAAQFADYLLTPAAQSVLQRHGFGAPVKPCRDGTPPLAWIHAGRAARSGAARTAGNHRAGGANLVAEPRRPARPRRTKTRSERHPRGHRAADRPGRPPGQFFVERDVQQRFGK